MFKKKSDEKTPHKQPDVGQEPVDEAVEGAEAEPEALKVLEKRADDAEKALETAQGELAAAKERYVRLLADFDNMRKRQIREREEVIKRANEGLLEKLLPVFDHLELALANVKAEDAFTKGVKMVGAQFLNVLTEAGVEVVDAEGAVFDPALHEALQAVPSETVPEHEVVQQFRKGWRLDGKLIRPAQVIVSAGSPAGTEEG